MCSKSKTPRGALHVMAKLKRGHMECVCVLLTLTSSCVTALITEWRQEHIGLLNGLIML